VTLRIGTRGSALALWQANRVADLLREREPGLDVELKIIRTDGDAVTSVPISAVGGNGVFVRQIETALAAGEIDAAVHSLKDLPTDQPDGLVLAAFLERHDPRDVLLSKAGWSLREVPAGARIGTGSPRRRCQILHRRPDIDVVPIRGNVDTRVKIDRVPRVPLDPSVCLPAVGQGAVTVEVRDEDEATRTRVERIGHESTAWRACAERSFLRNLGGGCLAPATAFATTGDGRIQVEAVVGDQDGRVLIGERESGALEDAEAIGGRLAKRLLVAGAAALLSELRDGTSS
jgi:hydroxymethylbilane synthase